MPSIKAECPSAGGLDGRRFLARARIEQTRPRGRSGLPFLRGKRPVIVGRIMTMNDPPIADAVHTVRTTPKMGSDTDVCAGG